MSETGDLPESGTPPSWDAAAAPAPELYDYDRILRYDQFIRWAFYVALLPASYVLIFGVIFVIKMGDGNGLYYVVLPIILLWVLWMIVHALRAGTLIQLVLLAMAYAGVTALLIWLGCWRLEGQEFWRVVCLGGALLGLIGILAMIAHHWLRASAKQVSMPWGYPETIGAPFKRGELLATIAQRRQMVEQAGTTGWRSSQPGKEP